MLFGNINLFAFSRNTDIAPQLREFLSRHHTEIIYALESFDKHSDTIFKYFKMFLFELCNVFLLPSCNIGESMQTKKLKFNFHKDTDQNIYPMLDSGGKNKIKSRSGVAFITCIIDSQLHIYLGNKIFYGQKMPQLLAPGGYIRYGEYLIEGVFREILEETNLNIWNFVDNDFIDFEQQLKSFGSYTRNMNEHHNLSYNNFILP